MKLEIKALRSFVGAKDFEVSREFYRELGFAEKVISDDLSLFQLGEFGFYLQKYYVKDWLNNTMLFIVVSDIEHCYEQLLQLELNKRYQGVRTGAIKNENWGRECFLVDPSGALLHFAEFY